MRDHEKSTYFWGYGSWSFCVDKVSGRGLLAIPWRCCLALARMQVGDDTWVPQNVDQERLERLAGLSLNSIGQVWPSLFHNRTGRPRLG
jgi:hypothetical protein